MNKNLTELEERIYDDGHRLIPGVTHCQGELIRHQNRYKFAKRIIEEDMVTRGASFGQDHLVDVLDLGTGVGYGAAILASVPRVSVVGIDMFQEAIEYAKTHYARPNISYCVDHIPSFVSTMKESDWDYVCAFEVFEHLSDGLEVFKQIRFRRLAIISTPYDEPPGVISHHAVWHVTEESFQGVVYPTAFFFTDIDGNVYDRAQKPETPINIIVVTYNRELHEIIQRVRSELQLKEAIRCTKELRNSVEQLRAQHNSVEQLRAQHNSVEQLRVEVEAFRMEIMHHLKPIRFLQKMLMRLPFVKRLMI